MLKNQKDKILALSLFLLLILFLTNSGQTIHYAFLGLHTWYQQMIPSLFPFLFLSNFLIKNNLTEYFIRPVSFLLKPVFQICDSCIFVIFFGFLCGFPLGAKCVTGLYEKKEITIHEAEYLLCFTNNFGPAYLCGFVYPLLANASLKINRLSILGIVLGIPFLYGILLRYTYYRTFIKSPKYDYLRKGQKKNKYHDVTICYTENKQTGYLESIPFVLRDSLYQIGLLGGYMIVFNVIRVVPDILLTKWTFLNLLFQSVLEISGGLLCIQAYTQNQVFLHFASFAALSFGGLSCYFQTLSLLHTCKLSGQKYMLHKMILCSITCLFLFFILQ